jgi:hypothetical protein
MATAVMDERIVCKGRVHSATDFAWHEGCRHPGALAAHEEALAGNRRDRAAAIEHWRRTGECGARLHDSRRAYDKLGCRCELATKLQREWEHRKRTPTGNVGRMPLYGASRRLTVGRINLMLLLTGIQDQPTAGERAVAAHVLSRRIVSDGPYAWRHLHANEIGDRLGVTERTVHRYRRAFKTLRGERHLRRLADVRAKAERVARAIERGRG